MLFAFFEVPSRKVPKILRIIEFNTSLLNPYLGGGYHLYTRIDVVVKYLWTPA